MLQNSLDERSFPTRAAALHQLQPVEVVADQLDAQTVAEALRWLDAAYVEGLALAQETGERARQAIHYSNVGAVA